jgi:hypothetical protein
MTPEDKRRIMDAVERGTNRCRLYGHYNLEVAIDALEEIGEIVSPTPKPETEEDRLNRRIAELEAENRVLKGEAPPRPPFESSSECRCPHCGHISDAFKELGDDWTNEPIRDLRTVDVHCRCDRFYEFQIVVLFNFRSPPLLKESAK